MKEFLVKYGHAIYLGFSLSMFLDAQWYKWEYYVVMIPTIILVEYKVNNKKEEE